MKIQNLGRDDLKLITTLQPEGWQDITPSIDFYTRSSFCFPLKILVDDELAGIGTAIIHHSVAWLAHIIVRPDFRNKGIGRFITEALINSSEVKKCETIYLIATDLGAPVYEKVGFQTESIYLYFKDVHIVSDVGKTQAIVPYKREFMDQVEGIDKMSSAEDRMFHLDNHLQHGFVYLNDKIEGFYLPTFGDGLIIADEPSAGLELLKLHLGRNTRLAFPKDNREATNFLYDKGFKEFSTGKRMRLGKSRPLKLENIYNRIGGNLG